VKSPFEIVPESTSYRLRNLCTHLALSGRDYVSLSKARARCHDRTFYILYQCFVLISRIVYGGTMMED